MSGGAGAESALRAPGRRGDACGCGRRLRVKLRSNPLLPAPFVLAAALRVGGVAGAVRVRLPPAFLLLRALCKLSVKESANDTVHDLTLPPDPVALQSKLLSLELLLSVLSHSGPSFRSSDKFVYAVKTYLCHSLVQNCVYPQTKVIGTALHIFVALAGFHSRG